MKYVESPSKLTNSRADDPKRFVEQGQPRMKNEFKFRPIYLSRKGRIAALVIYRIFEQKLKEKYTCEELIDTIRFMDMMIAPGEGYIPTYTRTDITDALHDDFGFGTDYRITSQKNMRKILNQTRNGKKKERDFDVIKYINIGKI